MAVKSQNLSSLFLTLKKIIPDLSEQYSSSQIDYYFQLKVRALHVFQIGYVLKNIGPHKNIADIGDSSGNHLKYIKHFHPDINAVSVNLDPRAVERITKSGGKAVLCDAHKINESGIKAALALSFETLEHLENPLEFLRNLKKGGFERVIITVPYRKYSRVGLHQYRNNVEGFGIEDVHIFELCPRDWTLLFRYAGWKVDNYEIYYQYPWYLSFMKYYWEKYDFEGFIGFTLIK
jgi:hypothetical protein